MIARASPSVASGDRLASEMAARIVEDARRLAEEEPLLSGMLGPILGTQPDFSCILSHVLAANLADPAIPTARLQAFLFEVLTHTPALIDAACNDIGATLERDPASESELHVLLYQKGFHAVQTYRAANALWQRGKRALALHLQSASSRAFGVDIHPACRIGAGVMLDHASGIVIGETSAVGDGASIFQNVTLGGTGKSRGDRHPKVGNNVVLGAGAVLLGPIRIGDHARVGAGSVVLQDVPGYATAVGVPARVIALRPGPKDRSSPVALS